MKLKKILKYLRNKDVQAFLLYSIKNLKKLNLSKPVGRIPIYLLEDMANIKYESILKKIESILLIQNSKYNMNKKKMKKSREILLAGEKLELNYDELNWSKSFIDNEDISAYHRFIWVYTDFIYQLEEGSDKKELYEVTLNLIKSWIYNFDIKQSKEYHYEIFQTYTISERLVNWFYLLSITSKTERLINKEIAISMCEQLFYICNNLEYYGEEFTSNHLLNNGKAIYIIGSSLGVKEFQNIGKKILLNEYKRVIVDNGFLREGSSHYQLLITKNYLDAYFVALKFEDIEFAAKLYPKIEELANASRFFMIKTKKGNKFPLIGDISPDYPPSWISTVPELADALLYGEKISKKLAIGYHTPFDIDLKKINNKIKNDKKINSNDWGKITGNNWTIFTHVNNSLYPNNLTGHFHHDTGGIVVFYKDKPIIIDCGRITYTDSARGNRDKSIRAHSGIYIDKSEPEIDMRSIYPKEFLNAYVFEKPEIEVFLNKMAIKINGYSRLKGITSVIRTIEIRDKKIKIIDQFDGKGIHSLDLFFHVPFDVERIQEKNILRLETREKIKINFDKKILSLKKVRGSNATVDGHAAVAYGKDTIVNTIIASTKLSFPNKITTIIYKEG